MRSFLTLFRMLCVYYPTKVVLRNANVTHDEKMTLLTSYKDNLLARFKEDTAAAKARREELKSRLAKIRFMQTDFVDEESRNKYLEHIVYDLAGYMLHSRKKKIGKCAACWSTILTNDDLPPDSFYADKLVVLKSKGGLKKATRNMFSVFLDVENLLIKHFQSEDAYIRDSFEKVVSKLSDQVHHPIGCCESHGKKLFTELIYDYVVIRFRFQAKTKKSEEVDRANSERHKKRKLSKLLTVEQVKNGKKTALKSVKLAKKAVTKNSAVKDKPIAGTKKSTVKDKPIAPKPKSTVITSSSLNLSAEPIRKSLRRLAMQSKSKLHL